MGATNFYTGTVTNGSMTISSTQNVMKLSIICTAGTVTYSGSASFNGNASTPVSFSVGQGVTLSSETSSVPLDGITITAATSGDSCDVTLTMQ